MGRECTAVTALGDASPVRDAVVEKSEVSTSPGGRLRARLVER